MVTSDSRIGHIHTHECKCISWKPIIAGAFVALGLSFLLNLFSVAIGLTSYRVETDGAQNLVLGGLVATSLGIVASMFAAGWLAGYLGSRHCTKRHLGALYGFLSWTIALIVTIFLAAHIQDYIAFYSDFISGVTGARPSQVAPASMTAAAAGPQGDNVVVSAYVIFALFFLSAVSASIGGHVGMRHVCKEEHDLR